jgi:hypothetical protein
MSAAQTRYVMMSGRRVGRAFLDRLSGEALDRHQHPWKYNLRALVQLMNRELALPHEHSDYSWNCRDCDEGRRLVAEAQAER